MTLAFKPQMPDYPSQLLSRVVAAGLYYLLPDPRA